MRAMVDLSQRNINDRNSEITVAEQKGKVEGLAEGEAKGELRGKRETAMKMLKKGMGMEDIVDITGLTVKEIEDLKR